MKIITRTNMPKWKNSENINKTKKVAASSVMAASEQNFEIAFCCTDSASTVLATLATTTYDMVSVGPLASSSTLSDREKYPYFSRTIPDDIYESDGIISILNYLYENSGIKQYKEIGILGSSSIYSTFSCANLIKEAANYDVTVKTYQSFLSNNADLSIELTALKNSGVRVFTALLEPVDMGLVLNVVDQYDIVGEFYIWICGTGCTNTLLSPGGVPSALRIANAQGLMGVALISPNDTNPVYAKLNATWQTYDPALLIRAGNPTGISSYLYDSYYFLATSIHNHILEDGFTIDGRLKNRTKFLETIRNTKMEGATGWISLDENGNRGGVYDIVNLLPGNTVFSRIGYWNYSTGMSLYQPISFFNGTTIIPDIDIRPPFNYWSCDDKKKESDLTGKTINVQKPGANNPSNIDINYYCDSFIDCENLSDESTGDCKSNYVAVFIIYGVIAIILIGIAIIFFIFTIFFGLIFPRRVVRSASPFFLIITIISCIIGYISIFTWFGKPQKVACGFQPWLLGLSFLSMIASLCAKNFRIWRIFKSPFDRKVISDLELIIFWGLLIIPGVIILVVWTIVATPDAVMMNVAGEDHLVCQAEGFTGPIGGIVFFFIFLTYCAFLLIFSGFISIVTRSVPSLFNESKLIAVSIYNLVFLSVVVIPVVIVLNRIDPFASWIIRTTAILYAFTATLWIQFTPKVFGVICVERFGKETSVNVKTMGNLTNTAESTFLNIPEAPADE